MKSFQQIYPFADDVKIAEPGSKSFTTGHLKLETGTTIVQYNKVGSALLSEFAELKQTLLVLFFPFRLDRSLSVS